MLPITADEAAAGLVPPAVATELLGKAGGILILTMLFMAIVSTGSAESVAVSSLFTYDIYRAYINPDASPERILFVSRCCIVVFGLAMGSLSIALHEIGVDLGWVYLFMGIVIGSAVCPLWNMMTWKKASGTGAVVAAWGGFILALIGWISAAVIQSGSVTIKTLGTNEVMLSGNLIAILSSGFIHYIWSVFIDPQDYDFADLETKLNLIVDDDRVEDEERSPLVIAKAERWVRRRGYFLTLFLIVIWPALSIPAGVFSKSYFAFWVLIAIGWGFGASITLFVLPLHESSEDIGRVIGGIYMHFTGKDLFYDALEAEYMKAADETAPHKKFDEESVESVSKPQDDAIPSDA
jgi:urea-proton symporter